jgi:hypothetical protein
MRCRALHGREQSERLTDDASAQQVFLAQGPVGLEHEAYGFLQVRAGLGKRGALSAGHIGRP